MIKDLMTPKEALITLSEEASAVEALAVLEDQGLRCAPILDSSQTIYRGTLYAHHVYKYGYHHPEADLNQMGVTRFMKNVTKVIHLKDSLLDLLFALKDLPYIAVLDHDQAFLGVVKHETLLNYLYQSWSMPHVGYALMVDAQMDKGNLTRITRIINRYSKILSVITIERNTYNDRPATLFHLPKDLDILSFQTLIKELERRKYQIRFWEYN